VSVRCVGLVAAVTITFGCAGSTGDAAPQRASVGGDGTCAYTNHSIAALDALAAALGRPIECTVVFNNAADSWDALVVPWFTVHADPDLDWGAWRRAQPGRRLIISQSLVPVDAPADWRERGAGGDHDRYAVALATNLVASGLGDSVIRLAHEANWWQSTDGLGPDPELHATWREAWRRFAFAMSSVEGADFLFDWTINPGVRPVAFEDYYPGDDVVDIIGVDIYDFWDTTRLGAPPDDPEARWRRRWEEPRGAAELVAFADERGKPLSIPEWGVASSGNQGGIGDNPSFVRHVAALVRDSRTIYQAYFAKSVDALVVDAPRSFEVYREAFGDATASRSPTPSTRPRRRTRRAVPIHGGSH
jgi:Glycosyl hydrolase family 26